MTAREPGGPGEPKTSFDIVVGAGCTIIVVVLIICVTLVRIFG